jgi:hypothetical protein
MGDGERKEAGGMVLYIYVVNGGRGVMDWASSNFYPRHPCSGPSPSVLGRTHAQYFHRTPDLVPGGMLGISIPAIRFSSE